MYVTSLEQIKIDVRNVFRAKKIKDYSKFDINGIYGIYGI